MRMRSKLLLSFSGICAFALIIGLVGYWGMTGVMKELDEIGGVGFPNVKSILTLKESQVSINMVENILVSSKLTMEERQFRYKNSSLVQYVRIASNIALLNQILY
jgi:hypothetical protein